jgi:hypothetical protein
MMRNVALTIVCNARKEDSDLLKYSANHEYIAPIHKYKRTSTPHIGE